MTMTMTYKLGFFSTTMALTVSTISATRAELLASVDQRFTGTVTFTVDGIARPDLNAEMV